MAHPRERHGDAGPIRRLGYAVIALIGTLAIAIAVGTGAPYLFGGTVPLAPALQEATFETEWSLSRLDHYFGRMQRVITGDEPDVAALRTAQAAFAAELAALDPAQGLDGRTVRAERPDVVEALAALRPAARSVGTLMAQSNAEMRRALPELQERIDAMEPDVAKLVRQGFVELGVQSDRKGQLITSILTAFGLLSALLCVALAGIALRLNRVSRQNANRADELREASIRNQAILDASIDAIVVAETDGTIREFNAVAEEIFECRAEDAVGRNLNEVIVPPAQVDAHDAALARYRATRRRRLLGGGRVRLEARRGERGTFPSEVSIQAMGDERADLIVAFIRDITAQVAAEEELRCTRDRALANERAKSDFVAVMSHEIRTPLNGLLGTLELLRYTTLSPAQRCHVDDMEASGQVLLGHVDDVLDISRIDAGKMPIRPEPFDPAQLLDDVVRQVASRAHANGNTLGWRWAGDPVPGMVADPGRLRQVLFNLVDNAAKFTQDGEIAVEIAAMRQDRHDEPHLEFRIRDTGAGIDPADMDRVFRDFETADAAYGRRAGGTGLGLGIVRRLVDSMGGEIKVDSEVGEGSEFRVILPLIETAAPEAPSEPALPALPQDEPAIAAPRALDILIVEDNLINRKVLGGMLRAAGHSFVEATDGEQGVQLAAAHRFDLILMDISMPVLDGPSATREIRGGLGRSADTPIVAVTAHALRDEVQSFRSAGMDDVIVKPVDRTSLARVIARLASGRDAADEDAQPHALLPGAGQAEADVAVPLHAEAAGMGVQAADQGAMAEGTALRQPAMPAGQESVAERTSASVITFHPQDHATEEAAEAGIGALMQLAVAEGNAIVDALHKRGSEPMEAELAARLHHFCGTAGALGLEEIRSVLVTAGNAYRSGDIDRAEREAARIPALWEAARTGLMTAEGWRGTGGP
ncbi:hybrid sensor histidine kinase/response regulator [Mesobaculum littorinae]|uniref:hybrid sensor histidine kinase/response regulator n=1 Tax=Mesobaculum littorinae TaxID=2486419 RepID=UPI0013E40E66|nr:ATP-binding protein [Mesobaculum littorinae]